MLDFERDEGVGFVAVDVGGMGESVFCLEELSRIGTFFPRVARVVLLGDEADLTDFVRASSSSEEKISIGLELDPDADRVMRVLDTAEEEDFDLARERPGDLGRIGDLGLARGGEGDLDLVIEGNREGATRRSGLSSPEIFWRVLTLREGSTGSSSSSDTSVMGDKAELDLLGDRDLGNDVAACAEK